MKGKFHNYLFVFCMIYIVGFTAYLCLGDLPQFSLIAQTAPISAPSMSLPDETPSTVDGVVKAISEIIQNRDGLQGLALVSAIMMLIFNFLKLPFIAGFLEKYIGPNWKRIIILSFGQIVGIILAISGGMGILDSIIAGLFTSGFATFLFEQIKPLFSKDPPPVLK